LLLGRFDDARTIYLEDKDKPRNNARPHGCCADDFAELRKFGVGTSDMQRIVTLIAQTEP